MFKEMREAGLSNFDIAMEMVGALSVFAIPMLMGAILIMLGY
jgi:hypothetical protein